MTYLAEHMALSLALAALLGLCLGWLLWGSVARRQGQEQRNSEFEGIRSLGNRDLFLPPTDLRPFSVVSESHRPATSPGTNSYAPTDARLEITNSHDPDPEKLIRELDSLREQLSLVQAESNNLQAELTEVTNTKAANSLYVQALLGQIHSTEIEARGAQLQDLQNGLAQGGESESSSRELADLRDRCDRLASERDSLSSELFVASRSVACDTATEGLVTEFERSLAAKDRLLSEQASRVETLLWRVAELEPFAAEAPRLQESLRRLESQIAGHVTLNAAHSEHIRSLASRVTELELQLQIALEEKNAESAAHPGTVQGQADLPAESETVYAETVDRKEIELQQLSASSDRSQQELALPRYRQF